MTLHQLASLFNLAGTGVVLVVSLTAIRKHPRPFFSHWLRAYGAGTALIVAELLVSFTERGTATSLVEDFICASAAWFFCQTARTLRGKPLPSAWFAPAMALSLIPCALVLLGGYGFVPATGPTVVVYALSQVYLGGVLIARQRAEQRRGVPWLGWPQAVLGVWVLGYPVVEASSFFVAGIVVSAVLDVLVGVGMLMYLLEEASDKLAERNAELVAALQHKRTFPSIVSHELRTPLAAIMGFHELLEDEIAGPLTAQQQEFLTQMQLSAAQLATLIDSLLDTFQLESGALNVQQEPVDLTFAIHEALLPLTPSVTAKSLVLTSEVPADLPLVRGDHQRIVQVLYNLAANAVKFTEVGGRLRVAARREGDRVRVEVHDTGVGITEAHLPLVFDSFFQGDGTLTRRYGGFGLGLSIVKALLVRMGGDVGVESRVGEGSCFYFTLALASDPARREPAELAL